MSKAGAYTAAVEAVHKMEPEKFRYVQPHDGSQSPPLFWVDAHGRLGINQKLTDKLDPPDALRLRDWLTDTFDEPKPEPEPAPFVERGVVLDLDGGHTDVVLLALAELTLRRPGWAYMIGELIVPKFGANAVENFEGFKKTSGDVIKPQIMPDEVGPP